MNKWDIKWEMVGEIKEDEEEWANVGGRTIGSLNHNQDTMLFMGETYLAADKETFELFYELWLEEAGLVPSPPQTMTEAEQIEEVRKGRT